MISACGAAWCLLPSRSPAPLRYPRARRLPKACSIPVWRLPEAATAPPQASFFADPLSQNRSRAAAASGSGPAFCVRSCDGRYFPLTARNASPAQLCQAFCPASPTKVFFGSNIDGASSATGERYADSENAYAYRKAMRADCTCNGRDPAGLAPVDLTLDTFVATRRRDRHHRRARRLFRRQGRRRPDRRIHAGRLLSRPDRRTCARGSAG